MVRLVSKGRPPNGGSGCHIWWEGLPGEPLSEVAATLEVVRAPGGPRISFWALQVTFIGPDGPVGAAHTGLQYNPHHPDGRAVNWGGYHEPPTALRELDGTDSTLPGRPGDPNTRDFAWQEGHPYRFHIHRGERGWVATVTDLFDLGSTVTIRELLVEAGALASPVVWAELFNHCDDPPSTVRWGGFCVRTAGGPWVRPGAARLNIPALATGGCDNIDARREPGGGFMVSTGAKRTAEPTSLHQLSRES